MVEVKGKTMATHLPLVNGEWSRPVVCRTVNDELSYVTVAELLAQAHYVAKQLPVTSSSYILNLCGNRYHFMVMMLAGWLQGKTVLLPPNTAASTLKSIAEQYQVEIVVVDDEQPAWVASGLGCTSITEWLSTADSQPVENAKSTVPELPADFVAAVVFTSGSTGQPKPNSKTLRSLYGIGQLESQWLANSLDAANGLSVPDLPRVTIVATVPVQHMFGLEAAIMCALFGLNNVWHEQPFYPADIHAALAACDTPAILVTTPAHLRVLVKAPTQHALPSVARVISATAPLDRTLAEQAAERYATAVWEIYGFSEAGAIARRNTTQDEAWQLWPGLKLTADSAAANDLSYWVDGDHLAEPQRIEDRVHPVSETAFVLEGRANDIVNVAGKRASLHALNQMLLAIPGVDDAVIWLPEVVDPTAHESRATEPRLMAAVVASDLTDKAILQALSTSVDPVMLPRPLLRVSQLPRNATGKLTLQALQELRLQYER